MTYPRGTKRLYRHVLYQIRRATLPLRRGGFSSLGEESLIKKYLDEMMPAGAPRFAVDIGAGDGRTGSNTLALFRRGWRGLAVELDARKFHKLVRLYEKLPEVYACRLRVTPENISALLEIYGVRAEFGLLSVDIDSYDYWVLNAVLDNFRPALVVTEINEKIPAAVRFRVNYTPDFRAGQHFFGYSIACLEELCARHNYALIDLEYNNAFLAPAELAGARALTPAAAYQRGYLERPDRYERFPRNENMEILHTLAPAEQEQFIRKFFSRHEGQYELSVDAK